MKRGSHLDRRASCRANIPAIRSFVSGCLPAAIVSDGYARPGRPAGRACHEGVGSVEIDSRRVGSGTKGAGLAHSCTPEFRLVAFATSRLHTPFRSGNKRVDDYQVQLDWLSQVPAPRTALLDLELRPREDLHELRASEAPLGWHAYCADTGPSSPFLSCSPRSSRHRSHSRCSATSTSGLSRFYFCYARPSRSCGASSDRLRALVRARISRPLSSTTCRLAAGSDTRPSVRCRSHANTLTSGEAR